MVKSLPQKFFAQDTLKVARGLLGCTLICKSFHGIISGKIVETEAYLQNDPGSHSYKGMTKRNVSMFGPAGHLYVYFIYGVHHCLNITTNKKSLGEAVLIRAVDPIANGPGKLTKALGITKKLNGINLSKSPIKIFPKVKTEEFEVVQTTRIGLTKGKTLPYRFYIKGNKFVLK